MGRRSRKRASTLRPPKPPPRPARKPSRSEARDAAAREALVPLREGERPGAVTVAAVVAVALAIANVVAYLAGVEVGDRQAALPGVLSVSGLLLIAAWGMWRAKYWAVLGMQAILGIQIVFTALALMLANNLTAAAVALVLVVLPGILFWHLVKAMARIQMPERAPR